MQLFWKIWKVTKWTSAIEVTTKLATFQILENDEDNGQIVCGKKFSKYKQSTVWK